MDVFLLWHIHELSNGEEDAKLIGTYSSLEKAEQAKQRALVLPGFQDVPEGFVIDKYILDRDDWTEGYIAIANDKLLNLNHLKVENSVSSLEDEAFEAIANQLADELIACVGSNVPMLSDYAVSRAGIYEEHP
jgi:hypothetical protein